MSTYRPAEPEDCPTWTELLRSVEEGRPLADHLQSCDLCRERSEFIEALSLAVSGGDSGVILGACPDEVDWAALADEGGSRAARMEMVEHLARCEQCSALWRHLVDIKGVDEITWEVREAVVASSSGDRQAEVRGIKPRFPRWMRPAITAVATVLVLIVLFAKPFPPVGSGTDARWRGPISELRADLSWDLGGVAPTLRWQAYPGATAYRIRLWDGEGELIVDHQMAAEASPRYPIEVPGAIADQMMLWQVEALDTGRVLASAGPTEVRWQAR